ncbi:MAG: hypothetical protein U0183_24415 [Polyangiaceae bacterium]
MGRSDLLDRLVRHVLSRTWRQRRSDLLSVGSAFYQKFFRTSQGARFVDQLVDGIAHESKVGYTTLTRSVSRQIAKDAELIATEQIEGATWHFFRSPVTGIGGPSAPLRQALEQARIGIAIH